MIPGAAAPPAAAPPRPAFRPTAGRPAGRPRRRALLACWPPAYAALATLAVALWKIQVPSFWRDEGATQSATQRSLPELIAMLGHVDAVHGAYYVLMWLVVRLAGHSELALRLPSALAMAAAAAFITVTGRRLVSRRAGLAAGLTFAALPAVSWFAQDARPFAMETAAGAAASYFLVRLAEDDGRRCWARWYAASLVALGLANVFGLLLIPAHAMTLAAWPPTAHWRAVGRRWLRATAAACVLLVPLLVAAWAQRAQVGWLRPPGAAAALATGRLVGSAGLLLAAAVLTGLGLAFATLGHRLAADWPARLPALGLPWLAGPPVILFMMSQVEPAYTFRYIVFCVPGAALLVGTGLAAAGRAAAAAGLALIVLLALPAQLGERGPPATPTTSAAWTRSSPSTKDRGTRCSTRRAPAPGRSRPPTPSASPRCATSRWASRAAGRTRLTAPPHRRRSSAAGWPGSTGSGSPRATSPGPDGQANSRACRSSWSAAGG